MYGLGFVFWLLVVFREFVMILVLWVMNEPVMEMLVMFLKYS